ncbi:MAG: HD domain-containing protein [Anaerolineaceae bacterium]|nr:HD domain-containing protein [Anaerolineaceae bacterium]
MKRRFGYKGYPGMQVNNERPSETQNKTVSETSLPLLQSRDWILSVMMRANEIARIDDANGMIQNMLDLMMEISLAESANFFQIDTATDELLITHVRGDTESEYLVGLRLNRQQGLPGLAFCDSKVVVVGDLPSEPDWLRVVDPVSAARKRNVINLPVANNDQTVGVIQIYNYQQAELDLLKVLSDRLAVEMDRRKEVQASRQSNQRLLTLVDMLGEVAGTLDRNRLLHLVTENASRLVGGERSSIFLVDPNTRDMIFQVAYKSPDPENLGAVTKQAEQTAADPGSNRLEREYSGSISRPSQFQPGEFSYFNRSAITVPLRSDSPTTESVDDQQHILGGLMVLNGQDASFKEEDAQLLHILANQASTFLQVAEMYEGAGELFLGVIKALATAIDAKDPSTKGHSQRVSDLSVLIATELGVDETLVNDLRIGSLFHDIGKIGIPDGILLKNGKLNGKELEYIKLHPRTGVNILSQVKLLEPMTPAILEHHERLDGSGYPAGLTDKQISWMGRIVAVADVYDAMTSNRPYRLGLSKVEVLAYLRGKAGTQFDPECVLALEQILSRPNPATTGILNRMTSEQDY